MVKAPQQRPARLLRISRPRSPCCPIRPIPQLIPAAVPARSLVWQIPAMAPVTLLSLPPLVVTALTCGRVNTVWSINSDSNSPMLESPPQTRRNLCLSTLVIAVQAQKLENLDQQTVLSLPLFPADIVSNHVPLTQALGVVGSYVQNGYVLFGLELHSKDGQEPIVNVNLPPKSHVDDGLRQIMGQLPGYDYEVISEHMINIYPVGAKNDPKDLL